MLHEPSLLQDKMASQSKQLQEGLDDGFGLKKIAKYGTSTNTHHLNSGSSSDHHLAHNNKISSHDPKSRSLDLSYSTSYTTNDTLISGGVSSTGTSITNSSYRETISANMSLKNSNDAKMVPFKWEEAPGRPINTSSCNELIAYNPSSLQLPPKLQCQSNQSPLLLLPKTDQSPLIKRLNPLPTNDQNPLIKSLNNPLPTNNQSLFQSSPNQQILKKLCKYMLKTASCTHRNNKLYLPHSWSSPPCIEFSSTSFDDHYKQQNKLAFNDRFFFDKYSPKDLRHCASMDSILPVFDVSHREDEFVSKKALSFLAMEEHEEAESSPSSSPWQPMSFHEREGSAASQWRPAPIKLHSKLEQKAEDGGDDDDDDDDEGFHDFFSTASSMKPSQRSTDYDAMETACSSPAPWYLDFSPEEEEIEVEKRGRKLIVTLVALIKLKKIISSKFKKRREGANHQLAENTMWSPTLATYLYNQQLEEEEKEISTPISSPINKISNNCSELGSNRHSQLGSNRLQIDPNYYLPSTFRTHLMNPANYCYPDDENSASFEVYQERQATESPYFAEEDEEERHNLHNIRHRLSLREQLSEFDDEYSTPFNVKPDNARQPSPCKGMCKVRKTVKVLASTIRLIWVHTEIGIRKGAQRSSQSYMKRTLNTSSPLTPTHK